MRCAATSSASLSYPLSHARRHFWNPFASFTKNDPPALDPAEQRNADQHAKIVTEAHRDADKQNELLLGACLDLLEMCGGSAAGAPPSDKLDETARDSIWTLVDVMLHDHRRTLAEQFDLVYAALCLPAAQECRDVQRCLLVVLHTVLPEALYRVFESVNLYVVNDDAQSQEQREALLRFVHAMLGDLRAPPNLEDEEVLAVYFDDVTAMFPALAACPAWGELEKDASVIALRAKLFALLGRLCAEFDKDKSGKVKLDDLRSTARRVLGEEQATQLLEGARPDKNGKIAYPQLAALLTRPPPKREVKSHK
ncbi:putative mitochondrial hypothetical protein [Leptomonas pyrrhocoris]|uniref:EF-hand domain-containing protein n=1 Tax=Leptomonas pyrrhocoris TaxID=157538 RepID=A0A0M9FZK5_LEPPY|nr:putative mitochondrial hypothetical protein [Leptomonas pyrrhocoris]KPA79159.1 putative mitochondrial hypothetical protein [Leptomonas pyrrhocoris]|eukprot:XP_015657598.1 putative mitochondrial hypothetical protein [Leptomonas pyrrhocoris]